jgi:hypothetical protein
MKIGRRLGEMYRRVGVWAFKKASSTSSRAPGHDCRLRKAVLLLQTPISKSANTPIRRYADPPIRLSSRRPGVQNIIVRNKTAGQ